MSAVFAAETCSDFWDEETRVYVADHVQGFGTTGSTAVDFKLRRDTVAAIGVLPAGEWRPEVGPSWRSARLGLLVIDGLLLCETRLGDRWAAEILGRGDLVVPPYDAVDAGTSVPAVARWHALTDVRFAILDDAFVRRAARWPALLAQVVAGSQLRSRRSATQLALAQHPRLEMRLLVVLWMLADRWGRVNAEGVVLTVPLTHELLGRMVCAQRPSVTLALGVLRRLRLVERGPDGTWLLRGEPPSEVVADGRPELRLPRETERRLEVSSARRRRSQR